VYAQPCRCLRNHVLNFPLRAYFHPSHPFSPSSSPVLPATSLAPLSTMHGHVVFMLRAQYLSLLPRATPVFHSSPLYLVVRSSCLCFLLGFISPRFYLGSHCMIISLPSLYSPRAASRLCVTPYSMPVAFCTIYNPVSYSYVCVLGTFCSSLSVELRSRSDSLLI
jgi:hypothetical protein